MTAPKIDDAVYKYVVAYKKTHDGNAPTLREIMDGCQISSTSQTAAILRRLARNKMITMAVRHAARGFSIQGGMWTMAQDENKRPGIWVTLDFEGKLVANVFVEGADESMSIDELRDQALKIAQQSLANDKMGVRVAGGD